jgi:hypothetical protein
MLKLWKITISWGEKTTVEAWKKQWQVSET